MKISPVSDAPHMVLRNAVGHLFLRGDANSCHEQHLGERVISDETVGAWKNHINSFLSLKGEIGFNFCFLPSPDKQSVFWESISNTVDNRNILKLLKNLPESTYSDPLPSLVSMREQGTDPYPTVDTHWNSLGAMHALAPILHRWGIDFPLKDFSLKVTSQRFEGDLGIKTSPRESGVAFNLDPRLWKNVLHYDNGVPDNGRIRIFSNRNALRCGRILLLGDSFSYRLAEILSLVFSEVFHFHGSFIDRKFIRLIRPNFFLFEQTERFFINKPRHTIESNFFRLVEEKIEAKINLGEIISTFNVLKGEAISLNQAMVIFSSEKCLKSYGLIDVEKNQSGFDGSLRALKSILN